MLMPSYVSPHIGTFSITHTACPLTSVKANTALLNLRGQPKFISGHDEYTSVGFHLVSTVHLYLKLTVQHSK